MLSPPGYVCSRCNTVQQPPQQLMVYSPEPPKSVGVAVVLSLLWLGAGHIYAGRIATGIVLAILGGFLLLLSLTGIGLFLAFPVWIIATPAAMAFSANAVNQFNRRRAVPS
jgi:TM2 domain-containing membrane protein YozV